MPGRRSQADLLNSRAGTEKHLAPDVRSEMEQQFGRSMTGLTILESPEVRQAGARAYAKGNVIRFAPGEFDQNSEGGKQMLSHEIAHVIQQSQGKVSADSEHSPLASDRELEAQADSFGGGISSFASAPAPLNAASFDSAPAQMWPWSKKKPTLTQEQQAQQNVAQQAQQEFQARQARQAAQSAAPQQHQVNTGKFEFNKIGYSFDKKLKEFKRLLDDYNTGGATPEQEIALMKAASDYIGKYSTGRKAKHQGRTKMMEDVLYQLTMKGGTRGKADANIERISGKVEGAPRPEEGQGKDMEKTKKRCLPCAANRLWGIFAGFTMRRDLTVKPCR